MIEPLRWKDQNSGVEAELGAVTRYAGTQEPSSTQLQRLTARVLDQLGAVPEIDSSSTIDSVNRSSLSILRRIKSILMVCSGVVVVGVLAISTLNLELRRPQTALTANHLETGRSSTVTAVNAVPFANRPLPIPASTDVVSSVAPKDRNTRKASRGAVNPRHTRAAIAVYSDPAGEIAILQRAKRLIEGRPNKSFDVVREHEKRYPDGLYREEREALAIEALNRLGRRVQAAERFRQFVNRYPLSAYRQRIEPWFNNTETR